MNSLNQTQRFKLYLIMSKKEKIARRSAMGLMREEGYTLKEISKRFNCSTDAVRINIAKINRISKTCPFIKIIKECNIDHKNYH